MSDFFQERTAELINVVAAARERLLEAVLQSGCDLALCRIYVPERTPAGLLAYEHVNCDGDLVATLEVILEDTVFKVYGRLFTGNYSRFDIAT